MSRPLILVAEDSPDLCDLWCLLLEDAGFDTQAVHDGATALEVIDGGLRPQLILLDYHMPDVDGLDVVAALRRSPDTAAIPVVLATGTRFLSTPAGVAEVLFKPFPPETLIAVVRARCAPTSPTAPTSRR